ncbi:MAG: CoA-binding protein, partial [Bacteroidales bacterium]
MINKELISPNSIVVVGGSNELKKPGGAVIKNITDSSFGGELYIVNPNGGKIQGVEAYRSVEDLPNVELAILSIPASATPNTLSILAKEKNCKAAIIFSAGFKELNDQGAQLEEELIKIAQESGTTLIGPNCIGVLTPNYAGVFTQPIPPLDPSGALLITGSGATAVFIMENFIKQGVKISSLFSVGNGATIGVEEVLEFLDYNYHKESSPKTILLYIESIENPSKLFIHASSLIKRGASIVALKSGFSEAGERAASSHTGAIASPNKAVDALFSKIGIIRVDSRREMVNMAALLSLPKPKGNKVAIITHAGGPAVILTDSLSSNGIEVPNLESPNSQKLLEKLYPGSSISNPIDFLATGTALQ